MAMPFFYSRLRLLHAIWIPFALMVLAVGAATAAISLGLSRQLSEALLARQSREVSESLSRTLSGIIDLPVRLNRVNAAAIESGALDLDDAPRRDGYFARLMDAFPEVSYAYCGRPDGSFYGARRNEADKIEIIHNDRGTGGASLYFDAGADYRAGRQAAAVARFDCRTRPWYQAAARADGPIFSEVYRHFVYRDLTITAAQALRAPSGGLRGVLGVDFRLDRINGFLTGLLPVPGATLTVVEADSGLLVGNSLGQANFRAQGASFERLTPAGLDHPYLAAAFAALPKRAGGSDNADAAFDLPSSAGAIHAVAKDFRFRNIHWRVLLTLPDAAYSGALARTTRRVAAVAATALALALAFGWFLAKRIVAPIDGVIAAAGRMAGGDWSFDPPKRSFVELEALSAAFRTMAERLHASIDGLEGTVQERTRALREANRAKDRIFALVAHDLRGPIGSMAFLFDLCAKRQGCIDEAELRELAVGFADSANGIKRLLDNLLTWALLQRGELPYAPVDLAMGEVVDETHRTLRASFDAKGISFCADAPFPTVRADRDLTATILRNLLSNAVKFTPRGGGVSVGCESSGGMARFLVRDDGVGMDAAFAAALFTDEAGASAVGTAGEKGTGLGLRLCKDFVERQGGAIWVDSAPGRGSVFGFSLPLATGA